MEGGVWTEPQRSSVAAAVRGLCWRVGAQAGGGWGDWGGVGVGEGEHNCVVSVELGVCGQGGGAAFSGAPC